MAVRDQKLKDQQIRESRKVVVKGAGGSRANMQKRVKSRPKFVRAKMWVSYVLSSLYKDRGMIPENIGNKILITNNMYITKYYMSSLIHIKSMSLETPVSWTQDIIRMLRDNDCNAVVDFTFKNARMDINLKESGYKARISSWEYIVDDPDASNKDKTVAARCLYTRDMVEEGARLMKSRIYITVRAKTGSELLNAEKLIFDYLNSIQAEYVSLVGDLAEKLSYISLISNKTPEDIKNIEAVVNSGQTFAQMLPNSEAPSERDGLYLGVNIHNYSEFKLDLRPITVARNVYVVAPSGEGKTVLALNLCCSACENGMAVCVQDIKGNEFNNFIESTGGYIISLRQTSSGYFNSWRMNPEDTTDEFADTYFKQRLSFSKEQMTILAGITSDEERIEFDELVNGFYECLYISLGVLSTNRNTWANTKHLNPFIVYEHFVEYMTPEMQRKYQDISRKVLNNLHMTMSREGSKSYIFNTEFEYSMILKAPTLMFDFGILDNATSMVDPVLFKLKFAYMRKLNADYIAYKYSQGIKVLKILEESQIAVTDPEIMKGYVEEFTLRRAQGQTSVLLGNSVSALLDNGQSKALVENTKALLIGKLSPEAQRTVIEKFGIEKHSELMKNIGLDDETKNSFLFINNMQTTSVVPLLKVILDRTRRYKLLSPVPQNTNAIK